MVNAKKKTMDLYEKKWTKNPFCYLKVKKGRGGRRKAAFSANVHVQLACDFSNNYLYVFSKLQA